MTRAINDDYLMTYQEIADELGISRVRVRQLEASALKKLRKRMALHQEYLDHVSSSSESRNRDLFLYV
jgi:DNA-directed RNA polymerase sigma subunit (sigma70/sigma32)